MEESASRPVPESPGTLQPNGLLRFLVFLVIVRPVMLVVMGMNVSQPPAVAHARAAIIVANHN